MFIYIYIAQRLNEIELARRRPNAFTASFDVINRDPTISSFLRDKYKFFYGDLMDRLKVDMVILDYNYTRLNMYMRKLIEERMCMFNLRPEEVKLLEEKEYPLLLEFYLQFDSKFFVFD